MMASREIAKEYSKIEKERQTWSVVSILLLSG
jgi:hypothetical protein